MIKLIQRVIKLIGEKIPFFNRNGSALIQVIMASGLLGLVSVASMQIQKNITKTQKKINFNEVVTQFENQIELLLEQKPETCETNISQISLGTNYNPGGASCGRADCTEKIIGGFDGTKDCATNGVEITELTDIDGTTNIIRANVDNTQNPSTLEGGSGINSTIVQMKYRLPILAPGTNGKGILCLLVHASDKNGNLVSSNKMLGGNQKWITLPINIKLNPSNEVTNCDTQNEIDTDQVCDSLNGTKNNINESCERINITNNSSSFNDFDTKKIQEAAVNALGDLFISGNLHTCNNVTNGAAAFNTVSGNGQATPFPNFSTGDMSDCSNSEINATAVYLKNIIGVNKLVANSKKDPATNAITDANLIIGTSTNIKSDIISIYQDYETTKLKTAKLNSDTAIINNPSGKLVSETLVICEKSPTNNCLTSADNSFNKSETQTTYYEGSETIKVYGTNTGTIESNTINLYGNFAGSEIEINGLSLTGRTDYFITADFAYSKLIGLLDSNQKDALLNAFFEKVSGNEITGNSTIINLDENDNDFDVQSPNFDENTLFRIVDYYKENADIPKESKMLTYNYLNNYAEPDPISGEANTGLEAGSHHCQFGYHVNSLSITKNNGDDAFKYNLDYTCRSNLQQNNFDENSNSSSQEIVLSHITGPILQSFSNLNINKIPDCVPAIEDAELPVGAFCRKFVMVCENNAGNQVIYHPSMLEDAQTITATLDDGSTIDYTVQISNAIYSNLPAQIPDSNTGSDFNFSATLVCMVSTKIPVFALQNNIECRNPENRTTISDIIKPGLIQSCDSIALNEIKNDLFKNILDTLFPKSFGNFENPSTNPNINVSTYYPYLIYQRID